MSCFALFNEYSLRDAILKNFRAKERTIGILFDHEENVEEIHAERNPDAPKN